MISICNWIYTLYIHTYYFIYIYILLYSFQTYKYIFQWLLLLLVCSVVLTSAAPGTFSLAICCLACGCSRTTSLPRRSAEQWVHYMHCICPWNWDEKLRNWDEELKYAILFLKRTMLRYALSLRQPLCSTHSTSPPTSALQGAKGELGEG